MADVGRLERQIAAGLARLQALRTWGRSVPQDGAVVGDLVNDLAAAFSDLGVTAERLRQRNEEILAAQQRIELAKQDFEELFEGAPLAYVVTTPGFRIERANRAAMALLRIRPGLEVGRDLLPRFHADQHDTFRQHVAAMEHGDSTEACWESHVAIVDEEVPVAVHGRAVVEGGVLTAVRWMLRDRTEEQIRHAEELRLRTLAAIGEMAAQVAHQIRNPMAGLRAMLEIVRERLSPDDPALPAIAEGFESIARCERTIASLLAFSKPWESKSSGCDLCEVADGIAARAGREPGTIQVRISGTRPCPTAMDAWIATHVFEELLENARHAMPSGGVVTMDLRRDERRVIASVRDEGVGMTADTLAKAFQPFFTTRPQGDGLGLATCRRIVEAHAGTIRASSAPGAGTTITVELPAR